MDNQNIKTETAWAIFSGNTMLTYTISSHKKYCIEEHCRNFRKDWTALKKAGDSCRKVTISYPVNNP